jgi:hypothetical protein
MGDFALLYTGGSMPETEEEQARVMKAWNDWYSDLGKAVKDGGNPFAPAAKTISKDGSVRDGAAGSPHTGYTIITADSLDSATTLAKGSPILQGGGTITVYEIVDVM